MMVELLFLVYLLGVAYFGMLNIRLGFDVKQRGVCHPLRRVFLTFSWPLIALAVIYVRSRKVKVS